MRKKRKWIKFRHRVARNILYAAIAPYSCLKYDIKVEPVPKAENRQFLILYNHQTPFDQFFVGMAFRQPVYYLATEDIFSNGFVSSVIRYLAAPIPIKKQTSDVGAVMICLRVAREGGTIAIAPEGNRTYSGKTEYINPAIATMAKKLNLPIAIFRIEGGYGVQPRWSDVVRKGKMRGYISRIIEPEEYADLDKNTMQELICKELYVNEAKADNVFFHKRLAEYLERAIYVCPQCGLSVLESDKDIIRCKKCGVQARYLPTTELQWLGTNFPFRFVNDWYEYQQSFINQLNLGEYICEPMFCDTASIFEVIVNKKKELLYKEAPIALFGDRIEIVDSLILPFAEVSAISVLGRNKLNVYYGNYVYQFKGGKRFNALKYVNVYYRFQNIARGDMDGKFLGL